MKKQVMKKAVELARRFEGDWVARMKMALKMAWAIIKKQVTIEVKRPIELIKEKLEHFYSHTNLEFNIWEKYGKSRIYVNGIDTGYFDFDTKGKIQKWYFDCGYDFKMKSELDASANLIQMGEF